MRQLSSNYLCSPSFLSGSNKQNKDTDNTRICVGYQQSIWHITPTTPHTVMGKGLPKEDGPEKLDVIR